MIDVEILREAVKQGSGFLLALIMFTVWLYEKRTNDRQLVGIIRDRKHDRDKLLELIGRVEGHLARSDAFREFAQQALDSAEDGTPKRRVLDQALADALARVERDQS